MNSVELTKIVGVFLAVALVVSLSNVIANQIMPKHRGEVRAYVVAAAEAEIEAPESAAPESAAPESSAPAESASGIAVLLAAADPAVGAKVVKKCTACHSLNQGGKHRLGPNLWDIVGRPVASAAGYGYSGALQGKSGETWSYDNLDAFLTKPKNWAPGTKMSFGGLKKPAARADLIVYLRSLSDSPAALPE